MNFVAWQGEWEPRAVCERIVRYSGECPTRELFGKEDEEHSRNSVLHHDFIPYRNALSWSIMGAIFSYFSWVNVEDLIQYINSFCSESFRVRACNV